ncbi:Hypothetical_protein [Hexamita inflata]|uniref:Hypothetical_protein n=1 Tax=Hexamita inflata TaxID=28002 RepID=A0AA86USX4_9EUKA|nr:Hypothetical protein HINF_LOCUS41572 [Hexamita inflata]CAI9963476.1 Hypothetical protein HINF_LOCUS51121 [Hexamita inflata]
MPDIQKLKLLFKTAVGELIYYRDQHSTHILSLKAQLQQKLSAQILNSTVEQLVYTENLLEIHEILIAYCNLAPNIIKEFDVKMVTGQALEISQFIQFTASKTKSKSTKELDAMIMKYYKQLGTNALDKRVFSLVNIDKDYVNQRIVEAGGKVEDKVDQEIEQMNKLLGGL